MDDRYRRLEPLGLERSDIKGFEVAIVGLGATGSHMAANCARLGTDLRLIDRDVLEAHNLSTSALYTEEMISESLPKAIAAENAVQHINSDIHTAAAVTDIHAGTIEAALDGADLILDGTDNIETRHLLNEYAQKTATPWIHVSVLGTSGEIMPIIPNNGACFNCLFADVDGAALGTCETDGVRTETAAHAASIATSILPDISAATPGLRRFDLAAGTHQMLQTAQRADCTVCADERFERLDAVQHDPVIALCGQDTYQVRPASERELVLDRIAEKLSPLGNVTHNAYLVRFDGEDVSFTVFGDGRAIVTAETKEQARQRYSEYVGL